MIRQLNDKINEVNDLQNECLKLRNDKESDKKQQLTIYQSRLVEKDKYEIAVFKNNSL